jgi:hypothetical protein
MNESVRIIPTTQKPQHQCRVTLRLEFICATCSARHVHVHVTRPSNLSTFQLQPQQQQLKLRLNRGCWQTCTGRFNWLHFQLRKTQQARQHGRSNVATSWGSEPRPPSQVPCLATLQASTALAAAVWNVLASLVTCCVTSCMNLHYCCKNTR